MLVGAMLAIADIGVVLGLIRVDESQVEDASVAPAAA
jgi:hypothetical protein